MCSFRLLFISCIFSLSRLLSCCAENSYHHHDIAPLFFLSLALLGFWLACRFQHCNNNIYALAFQHAQQIRRTNGKQQKKLGEMFCSQERLCMVPFLYAGSLALFCNKNCHVVVVTGDGRMIIMMIGIIISIFCNVIVIRVVKCHHYRFYTLDDMHTFKIQQSFVHRQTVWRF